jgi:hypothetical protein
MTGKGLPNMRVSRGETLVETTVPHFCLLLLRRLDPHLLRDCGDDGALLID